MRPLILALVTLILPPLAAAEGGITVELNKLEAQGEACRAYLVFQNGTGSTLEELKLDLVLFGSDGVISRRLALDAAPLRSGKTTVKLFDVAGLACGGISRILINDTLACQGSEGPLTDCIGLIETSSRSSDVALVK